MGNRPGVLLRRNAEERHRRHADSALCKSHHHNHHSAWLDVPAGVDPNIPLSDGDLLPKDVFLTILQNLEPCDLAKVAQVCKLWLKHSKAELVWKHFCERKGFSKALATDSEFAKFTWHDLYVKYASRVLLGWKWNAADKDASIDVTADNNKATRQKGGHNPSIRGDRACGGTGIYYFEVLIDKVGEWISFGFASKEFGVSCLQHTGKGKGSCAYYSDSSTWKVFVPGQSSANNVVQKINDGDKLGCMIDMRKGEATFFVNGEQKAVVSNSSWANQGDDKTSNGIELYPALSLGCGALVSVVAYPSLPKKLLNSCGSPKKISAM